MMRADVTRLLLMTKAHFTPTGLEDVGFCCHVVSHQRQQLWENLQEESATRPSGPSSHDRFTDLI